MPAPIFLPSLIKRTQKCERCGLLFPKKAIECPHCTDLNDRELSELKQEIQERHVANKNLGMVFMAAAIAMGVIFVLILAL